MAECWEYKVVELKGYGAGNIPKNEETLKQLGLEHWELVSVVSVCITANTHVLCAFLKRELP